MNPATLATLVAILVFVTIAGLVYYNSGGGPAARATTQKNALPPTIPQLEAEAKRAGTALGFTHTIGESLIWSIQAFTSRLDEKTRPWVEHEICERVTSVVRRDCIDNSARFRRDQAPLAPQMMHVRWRLRAEDDPEACRTATAGLQRSLEKMYGLPAGSFLVLVYRTPHTGLARDNFIGDDPLRRQLPGEFNGSWPSVEVSIPLDLGVPHRTTAVLESKLVNCFHEAEIVYLDESPPTYHSGQETVTSARSVVSRGARKCIRP